MQRYIKTDNGEMDDYTPELLVARIKELDKEIETLRGHNDKCRELRLKFIDAQVTVAGKAEKEIEALKFEGESLFAVLGERQQEIELLRQQLVDLSTDWVVQKRRGDEWKRRVGLIREWSDSKVLLGGHTFWTLIVQDHPEAAEWFEEE